MKVDLVIATYNRAEQLRETLINVRQYANGLNKTFIVNNNSTDHTKDVLNEFKSDDTIIIHNIENLGAAGGKNVGLRLSNADIIIVIDDDAVFCTQDPVGNAIKQFKDNERLGLIQFKIINYQTKTIQKYEFPGVNPEESGDDLFDIGYYIGAGHAIRKNMLEEVGYYADDFGLYAHEEIDLSYRAINNGYIMRYIPSIAILHKKDPRGRLPPNIVFYNMFYYRLVMTHKYIPLPYSIINNFLWFVKTVIDSHSISLAISAYRKYLLMKPTIVRDLLSSDALAYMRRNNGRLFR